MTDRRASAQAALAEFGVAGLLRQVLPFGIIGLLLWYFAGHLSRIDPAAVIGELATIRPGQWALALGATAVSFWAVGCYDAVVHRTIQSSIPTPQARRAGIAAIALSQTLGMGLLTGALVRWRMLPGLTLWQATRLSLTVALSFLAGWAVVAATALVLLPLPVPLLYPAALAVLFLAGLGTIACILRPDGLPPVLTLLRILLLAAIDTGAAALAFYLLLPAATHLDPLTLLPAFLLALGAGLATGTPGGVGPFEVTLLALLPATDPASLFAAILAFRLTYYAIPAIGAGLLLLAGPRPAARSIPAYAPSRAQLTSPARAEAQLIRQGPFALWADPGHRSGWLLAETGQAMVVLGDPVGPARWEPLQGIARHRDRLLCHYKCGPRLASRLRAYGYATLLIGQEAMLTPATFRLDTPTRAGLRRKLRKVDASGTRITEATTLPLADMARVSAAWSAARGGERGFSMGRFHPATHCQQKVYLAHLGGNLTAFLTLHTTQQEWTLDLMRHTDAMADGTMHALLARAIADAAALGIPQLSLAAAPPERSSRLCALIDRATGAAGLRQFKSAFAPHWRPLYLAAPSRTALVVAGLEIARAIARPPVAKPPR